jgi:hypothetical protein
MICVYVCAVGVYITLDLSKLTVSLKQQLVVLLKYTIYLLLLITLTHHCHHSQVCYAELHVYTEMVIIRFLS